MWLIALKGSAGLGKSTIGRALSRYLNWPLIDKDDVKDLLWDRTPESGPLAYEIMFNIARRQLLQGLNVICDSPLAFQISYERVQALAAESGASLAIIECYCTDPILWAQRIDARKELGLPGHHQTDWASYQGHSPHTEEYTIAHPHLKVDTVRPLAECLIDIKSWLEEIQACQV